MSSRNRSLIFIVIFSHNSRLTKVIRYYALRTILFDVEVYWTVFDVFHFHNQEKYALCGVTCQQEKKLKKGVDHPRKVWFNYLRYEEVHSMGRRSEHRSRSRQGVSQPHLQVLDYMRCAGWQVILSCGQRWLARLQVSGAASRPRKGFEGEAEERPRLCGRQVYWCQFYFGSVFSSRLQVRAGLLQPLQGWDVCGLPQRHAVAQSGTGCL